MNKPYLVVNENDPESQRAIDFLVSRQIDVIRIAHTSLGAEKYRAPTLITRWDVYQGIDAICHGEANHDF